MRVSIADPRKVFLRPYRREPSYRDSFAVSQPLTRDPA
ncbi:hypothetical protein WANA31_1064, partial [Wolbachia endosymbiont of Drosophila ananassae]